MQEDIEHRTVTIMVNGGKLTGRMLKSAIAKVLAHWKNHKAAKDVTPHGKQSVKKLIRQNQGVSTFEIKDKSIREFERIARKYGVDFAVKKVKGKNPKYLIFFKGRDADALTSAFKEYTAKKVRRASRPSILKRLRSIQASLASVGSPAKEKKKVHSR